MGTIILLIEIFLLNIIDCAQTVYAIQLFGLGIESNPVARFMFENNVAIPLKLIAMPIVLVIVGVIVSLERRFRWVVCCIFMFYVCIVLHNCFVLVQLGAI